MSDTIAERYARAIFAVGEEAGNLQQVAEHFQALAKAYQDNRELRVVLNDPRLAEAERVGVVEALVSRLGVCSEARNSLRVMMQRRRLAELGQTARRLMQLADDETGVLRARVESAKPLSESYEQQLKRELEKVTGRRVVLDQVENPNLIAGLVLEVGSRRIDGSLLGRLHEFERRLARAS